MFQGSLDDIDALSELSVLRLFFGDSMTVKEMSDMNADERRQLVQECRSSLRAGAMAPVKVKPAY